MLTSLYARKELQRGQGNLAKTRPTEGISRAFGEEALRELLKLSGDIRKMVAFNQDGKNGLTTPPKLTIAQKVLDNCYTTTRNIVNNNHKETPEVSAEVESVEAYSESFRI